MSLELFTEGDCIAHTTKPCPCIEFAISEQHRHGFHSSQLIHYALEPNPEGESDKNKPPQKLTLTFATADVTLTGWRLAKLCDDLRDGRLLGVRTLPERYANLDRNKPHVISITVRALKPSE